MCLLVPCRPYASGRCRNRRQAGFERTLLVGPARRLGVAPGWSRAQGAGRRAAGVTGPGGFTGHRPPRRLRVSRARVRGRAILRRGAAFRLENCGAPRGSGRNRRRRSGAAACERLLLRGDVDVQLGTYHFTAAQATVWVQRAGAPGGHRSRSTSTGFRTPGACRVLAGGRPPARHRLIDGLLRCDPTPSTRYAPPPFDAAGERARPAAQELLRATGQGGVKAASPDAGAFGPGRHRPGLSRPFEPNSPPLPVRGDGDRAASMRPATRPMLLHQRRDRDLRRRNQPRPGPTPQGQEEIKIIRGGTNEDETRRTTRCCSPGASSQYQDVRQTRNLQISARARWCFVAWAAHRNDAVLHQGCQGHLRRGDVVATDGQYTLRGPRVFYDVQKNQALMVDAVFFTYDTRIQAPDLRPGQGAAPAGRQPVLRHRRPPRRDQLLRPVMSVGVRASRSRRAITPRAPAGRRRQAPYLVAKEPDAAFRRRAVLLGCPAIAATSRTSRLRTSALRTLPVRARPLKTGWNVFGLLGLDRPDGLRSAPPARLLLRPRAGGNQTSGTIRATRAICSATSSPTTRARTCCRRA